MLNLADDSLEENEALLILIIPKCVSFDKLETINESFRNVSSIYSQALCIGLILYRAWNVWEGVCPL